MTKHTKLRDYFPMLRTRAELMEIIHQSRYLSNLFFGWKEEQRQEFLDFCTGVRGVKLLYDSFFKEIMSPETAPERLEEFLSLLIGTGVSIREVLTNDSVRLADEGTLLVTDIVVQLTDGSIANVEVQKIGWAFPGQRSACYSADLLLRQYKRVRSTKKSKCSYRDIKSTYVIVLFEKSPEDFQGFSEDFLHYFQQKSNTGLELELLQKYIFVPLDIFHKILQDRPIRNKLEAWLTFLSNDEPTKILELIQCYPEFQPMYEQVYAMCRNVEGVMGFFSEELRILDRNTAQLMIDEMEDKIKEKEKKLKEKEEKLKEKEEKLKEKDKQLAANAAEIAELKRQLAEQKNK